MIGKLTENSQLIGNISMGGSSVEYEAGTGIDITDNVISNTITSYNDLTDKPNIPTLPTTQVYSSTFTYNRAVFTQDYAINGNIVDLEINTDDIGGAFSISNNYKITTLDASIRPAFEVCVPIMTYGTLCGVSWITVDGEVYIRLSQRDFGIFRLHIAYLTNN